MKNNIKISIIYDNTALDENLISDWGFSCLIEGFGKTILFDTGAKENILFANMKKMDIDPLMVDVIFISHNHWDHTGGLSSFLSTNNVPVFAPAEFMTSSRNINLITCGTRQQICENIWSTGTLSGIEQSLLIKQEDRVTVIAGCSHPGIDEIFTAGRQLGHISALIGGLHGFKNFDLLKNIDLICPTHCTQYIDEIKSIYPDKYIKGGAGRIITI
ncbi:MAG: MBL fold metallo-hydrolase [Desulfobacteraceae bacterium]|nr:MBL fold metallo-hydrolase [Desulfobacteraceae bacterium]MBC2755506.1 MBL fold metallo-hydrolase [Desulfobacteraceae bacterium]